MKKSSKTTSGFTLTEVLVSVGIMVVFLPFAASMLVNSQLLASYSKHKIQAAYAAQQIIETQRQNPFLVIAAGNSVTVQPNPASVILDTKGNYVNATCSNPNIFCGTATITVTPAVYTSTSGAKVTSTAIDHFVVTISWNEQILKLKVPMTETYAQDIVNDPMLN
jgi:prepilin-type N-terminal cleavage/methylation domain-containing protein